MKKIFVIILFIFLWSNQVLAEANSEGDPMYYNEPSKRIYILWDSIGKKDHFELFR